MRKMLVIAIREYYAAVRTKTFIVSLVIIPVMMVGSLVVQLLLSEVALDTADKHFVLLKHRGTDAIVADLQQEIKSHNEKDVLGSSGQQIKPRFIIDQVQQAAGNADALGQQRFQLSEQVRRGDLVGFMEIIPNGDLPAYLKDKDKDKDKDQSKVPVLIRYQTNQPTYKEFSIFVKDTLAKKVRNQLREENKLSKEVVQSLSRPVALDSKGLSHKDPVTGKIEDSSKELQYGPVIVPVVFMMLLFLVVMMTATPFMQSVVEEKMQRIAEVLLGSVPPFELMLGKLIGMVAVSLTIAAVYLGGAYWAAWHFGISSLIPPGLLVWFVVLQSLASLMYGSLFIAIGAACTDMKETQNLLLPVMLVVCLPFFFFGPVMQQPNSALARGLSLFPFATPMLLMARIAAPPGLPWWEPALGVLVVLATTVLCVWAAGRIFRVGILMQGKGAKIGQLFKWIFHG
jgi:ABC-2 type transport system permease protein